MGKIKVNKVIEKEKKNPFIAVVREQLYALWRFFALMTVALLAISFAIHAGSGFVFMYTSERWFRTMFWSGVANISLILFHMVWSFFFYYRKISKYKKTMTRKKANCLALLVEILIALTFSSCFFGFCLYLYISVFN